MARNKKFNAERDLFNFSTNPDENIQENKENINVQKIDIDNTEDIPDIVETKNTAVTGQEDNEKSIGGNAIITVNTAIKETKDNSKKEDSVVPVAKGDKKDVEKCKSTYSLTKVNAFFVQKTAIQKNSTIDIIFSNIIKEWLEADVTFSDEEIMDIIDFYAKERSAYIRKTYSVPVPIRELLSRKAGELGIKTTPLINHIITAKRQGQ